MKEVQSYYGFLIGVFEDMANKTPFRKPLKFLPPPSAFSFTLLLNWCVFGSFSSTGSDDII